MDITDLIADSKDEYIKLCTKLANNKEFYNNIRNQINSQKHKLFQDQETLIEWRELMDRTDL